MLLIYRLASNFVFSISCCSAEAADDDVVEWSDDFFVEFIDDVAVTSAVFSPLLSVPELIILCLTTKLAVPSFSFFMKFQASIRDILVQSVLFTDIISSPTFNVPFLSAAPPKFIDNSKYRMHSSKQLELILVWELNSKPSRTRNINFI